MFKKKHLLKVVIFESATGFRWQVWDNEDILGVSPQGFSNPTACLEDWFEAGKQIAWFMGGGVADRKRFDFIDGPLGIEWAYWSPEGEPIAKSSTPSATLKEAQKRVTSFVDAVTRRFDLPTEEMFNGQFKGA